MRDIVGVWLWEVFSKTPMEDTSTLSLLSQVARKHTMIQSDLSRSRLGKNHQVHPLAPTSLLESVSR